MHEGTRYLLARPTSGFVDILNQVVTSFEWAQALSRHLVVDCRWGRWRDDLSHYFEVIPEYAADVSLRSDDDALAQMTVHPAHLSDIRSRSYARKLVRDDAGKLRITHAELGVDLSSYDVPDCRKDVIVHHPIGGGRQATVALRMLTLTAELRRIVGDVASGLPKPYNAIHLRNTDLVASFDDARTQIALLDPKVPILVASDNSTSLAEISKMCPQNQFFRLATIFSAEEKPMHFDSTLDARKRNVEVFIDLLALASSESLVLPTIARGGKRLSGFSWLAKELQDDFALLNQLVSCDAQR